MNLFSKILLRYVAPVFALFLISYLFLGVRESRLYLVLMGLNLPASLVVIPAIEELAIALSWTLGGSVHVWLSQLICMAANGFFFYGLARLANRFSKPTRS